MLYSICKTCDVAVKLVLSISIVVSLSCSKKKDRISAAIQQPGKNKPELEKVIRHYERSNQPQKLKAAYFLIENLPDQFFYEGEGVQEFEKYSGKMDSIIKIGNVINYKTVWDSLQNLIRDDKIGKLKKRKDIEIVTADFLINNIELAFKAWAFPWNRELSFDEFCKFVLPYKLKDESPEDFRTFFINRYSWITDSLKNIHDQGEVINLVNKDLKKWFYITKLSAPFDLSFGDLLKLKSGRCPQEVQIATYALRALGIPVAMEGVPFWANRSFRHDWNGWIKKDRTIAFLGTEIDPGEYKMEFARPASIHSKRPKVFRTTYEYQTNSLISLFPYEEDIPSVLNSSRYIDVTDQYIPVSDIKIKLSPEDVGARIGYICVFNNKEWKPIDWGVIKPDHVKFHKMGRGIVYLPVVIEGKECNPLSDPLILMNDGETKAITFDKNVKINCDLKRKYPAGKDNEIVPGTTYELFYWNNDWVSLGKKVALSKIISYNNVPKGALLWLRNLSDGFQERIFTWENNQQVWW